MASLNRVFLVGNLGSDPELRYTANQTAVTSFNIATTDVRTGADGQRQETTEWHRIVVWGRQAENCSKYLAKGRSVFIEGRLQTRTWDDQKTGVKRSTTEIVAQAVQFLGGGAGAGAGARDQGSAAPRNYSNNNGSSDSSFEIPNVTALGGLEAPDLDDIPF